MSCFVHSSDTAQLGANPVLVLLLFSVTFDSYRSKITITQNYTIINNLGDPKLRNMLKL